MGRDATASQCWNPEAGDGWGAARAWARSGVMSLCGHPSAPPLMPPLAAPARLDALVDEIRLLTGQAGREVTVRWDAALAGRARILRLTRAGRTSANGSCRILTTPDGDVALNLPRADDLSLVPALTGVACEDSDPWAPLARFAACTPAAECVSRARLLGLAASVPGERENREPDQVAYRAATRGDRAAPRPASQLTVVDLSSLWAGPVAGRVLSEAGATVVKVEDPARPDGSRGLPGFYSWIHPARETVEPVEFASHAGRARLASLLDSADVVIESSRPRALEQMGLAPEQRPGPPGQVWLSITGHGRSGEARRWTGFGDDAAIAGGMLCRDAHGSVTFCGDAVADPVTGLVGALAVLRGLATGQGQIVDVSLSGAAAWASAPAAPAVAAEPPPLEVERDGDGWLLRSGRMTEAVAPVVPVLDWVYA